jgi:hypothetical protein
MEGQVPVGHREATIWCSMKAVAARSCSEEGDMDAILRAIRGLGGTVLKTNVDLERAKLIQSTLAASADTVEPDGRQIGTHWPMGKS